MQRNFNCASNFDVFKEFLGLYNVPSIDAVILTATIENALETLGLPMDKVGGQCYDGAASTTGKNSGETKRISELEPRALLTHCYGHSLNLAAGDALKNSATVKDALETTREITKLVTFSPRREAIFRSTQAEHFDDSAVITGIRLLCPTRWTVRAEALGSIIDNTILCSLTPGKKL